jgi:translation initiation factor 5
MLLTCIEDLIGVVERKLLPYAPHILKTLYENDVLEENTLIAWFDAPPEASWLVNKDVAAEVRAKAKPFIEWLRSAEEEDDE